MAAKEDTGQWSLAARVQLSAASSGKIGDGSGSVSIL